MKSFLIGTLLFTLTAYVSHAGEIVPQGVIVEREKNEVKFKTPTGTIVEVEYNVDGSFDEASGDNADRGDVLVPEAGIISLESAVTKLKKAGKTPIGDWSLEKKFVDGWVYEFEGFENGKKMEYRVSGKDGSLISSTIDD